MNARSEIDFATLDTRRSTKLEAIGVSVSVGDKKLLQSATCTFQSGQVTAIVGPNGAGKSTLMSVLTGERTPSAGSIQWQGRALQNLPLAELARVRAFVAQETQVAFDFTVREVVELGRYPHRRQPSTREAHIPALAMESTHVNDLASRALNTLSGGEKARTHLARALAQVWESTSALQARWLLLDEPTAALDLQHQHRVLQLARTWAQKQQIGVVAVLHDLNLALRYSDCTVLLADGQLLAQGKSPDVLSPERIAQVWGVTAHPVVRGGLLQYVFEPGANTL